MRTLISLFILTCLPILSTGVDLEKFALTLDLNINWNASGFNDSYRLYTLRKDVHGNRRQCRQLATMGLAYQHLTESGILIQPSFSIGDYFLNKNHQYGLGSGLLISKYNFQKVKRYLSFSAFQSFGKGQKSFLKTINLGLIYNTADSVKGPPIHRIDVGIGFSLMHVDGTFIPGININTSGLGFWFGAPS